jgi:hypothetical protein
VKLVYPTSLARTVDAVDEALFYDRPLTKADRLGAARFIASRQGLPGSYHDMFAPTERDYRDGIRLFTGERLDTGAGTGHILSEESCRALLRLGVRNRKMDRALANAAGWIAGRLARMERDLKSEGKAWPGLYCCSKCSVALWRNLAAGGLPRREHHLRAGLKTLSRHRTDNGRWRWFPFWYSVLALSEMDLAPARAELRHAAPSLERVARRKPSDARARRRHALAERVLERVA